MDLIHFSADHLSFFCSGFSLDRSIINFIEACDYSDYRTSRSESSSNRHFSKVHKRIFGAYIEPFLLSKGYIIKYKLKDDVIEYSGVATVFKDKIFTCVSEKPMDSNERR